MSTDISFPISASATVRVLRYKTRKLGDPFFGKPMASIHTKPRAQRNYCLHSMGRASVSKDVHIQRSWRPSREGTPHPPFLVPPTSSGKPGAKMGLERNVEKTFKEIQNRPETPGGRCISTSMGPGTLGDPGHAHLNVVTRHLLLLEVVRCEGRGRLCISLHVHASA